MYIVVGDGGNREGLHTSWIVPQPSFSLFRQASFGHGEIVATNATHLRWTWMQNRGPSSGLDEAWMVKGDPGRTGPGVSPNPTLRGLL